MIEYSILEKRHEEVIVLSSKCPGQDMRNLRAAIYKCPNCGSEVEMFSDELKLNAKSAGNTYIKTRFHPVSNGAL